MKRFILGFLVPIAILGAAGLGAAALIDSAESAERTDAPRPLPLVEVTTLALASDVPQIIGTGVVEAAREVALAAEVGGKVTAVSPKLVVGGRVHKGDVLVQVDARNYELSVRERRAQVDQADLELELEQGRGALAKREWDMLAATGTSEATASSRLVLREPQLASARVALESAHAALERAKLDLSRSVIRAPFNATVSQESIEVGQVVSPGVAVATLIGTDEFWVHASVRVEALSLIELPSGDRPGAKAIVTTDLGDTRVVAREGRVIRLVNELDRESRMAKLIIAVKDPLDDESGQLPLLRGAFVSVRIEGKTADPHVAVPRVALGDGNKVWVVDANDVIHRRALKITWQDDASVFASTGVEAGERVLSSNLALPVDGMKVRVRANDAAALASEPSPVPTRNVD